MLHTTLLHGHKQGECSGMCGIDNKLTLKGGKIHKRQKERQKSFNIIVARDMIEENMFMWY